MLLTQYLSTVQAYEVSYNYYHNQFFLMAKHYDTTQQSVTFKADSNI